MEECSAQALAIGQRPIHTFQHLYVNDTMYHSLAYASKGKHDTMSVYKINDSISYGQIIQFVAKHVQCALLRECCRTIPIPQSAKRTTIQSHFAHILQCRISQYSHQAIFSLWLVAGHSTGEYHGSSCVDSWCLQWLHHCTAKLLGVPLTVKSSQQ